MCLGNEKKCYVNYEGLPRDVKAGTVILIDDGLIEMEVISVKNSSDIHCKVNNGGVVSNKKGVNVPDVELSYALYYQKDMT